MAYDNIAVYLGFDCKYYKSEWTNIEFEKIIKKFCWKLNWGEGLDWQSGDNLKVYPNWLSLEKDCELGKIDCLFIPTIDVFNNDISLCLKKMKKLKEMGNPPLIYFVLEDICSREEYFYDSIRSSYAAKALVRIYHYRKRMMNKFLREK